MIGDYDFSAMYAIRMHGFDSFHRRRNCGKKLCGRWQKQYCRKADGWRCYCMKAVQLQFAIPNQKFERNLSERRYFGGCNRQSKIYYRRHDQKKAPL